MAGYEWRLRIASDVAAFPAGCDLVAHVRRKVTDAAIAATLSTDNGGIVRISDTEIEFRLSGAASAGWASGRAVIDVVRRDVDPDEHLGFVLDVPVMLPVTRGLA
jgi:hypothetical protein